MENKFYDSILKYLLIKKYICDEEKELYMYAIKTLIRGFINITAVFIIGLLLDMLKESAFMFLSFFILRSFAGGIHSEKYISCFLWSSIINIIGLILIKNSWYISKNAFITIVIVFCLLIVLFSPIKHPHKHITHKETKMYKIVASIFAFTICVISIILVITGCFDEIGYSLGTGLVISSILMVCGKIKY